LKIFVDSRFTNKEFEDRKHSEALLLLIVHSVSIHLLSAPGDLSFRRMAAFRLLLKWILLSI